MNQQITSLSQSGQPIQMTLPQQQQQHQLQPQQLQSQQLQPQQMPPSQQQLLMKQMQQQAFILQQQSQQKQQQQQSPRVVGSPLQRAASLTGSQQETHIAPSGNTSTGLANHGPESSNHVPAKRKITEIISQVLLVLNTNIQIYCIFMYFTS
jgi:hypothetical protein